MQIVCTMYMLYNFRVLHERKEEGEQEDEEEEEEKEREKRTKLTVSLSIFSTVRMIIGTLGVYFTLEWLRVSSIRLFQHRYFFRVFHPSIRVFHLFWSSFHSLSTGWHFEPSQSLLKKYSCTVYFLMKTAFKNLYTKF